MLTALLLGLALAAPSHNIDELFLSLPGEQLEAWQLGTAEERKEALTRPGQVLDRKHGYLEFTWNTGPLEYKLQVALFLLGDQTPLVAVSYWEGSGSLFSPESVLFYRADREGHWTRASPLPDLREEDFHFPKGAKQRLKDDLLLYRFELPREGTTVRVVAEFQRLPAHHDDSGPTGEYTVDLSSEVKLRWDKQRGTFAKVR